jgi:GNAT superfamily N-acetyltransferase
MHRAALAGLAGDHYTPAEIDGFLADVEMVDATLIRDGTYYVIEQDGALAASGGWTMRRPSYGAPSEEPWLWSPGTATIRAIFTDPGHARKGLARRVMELAEDEAAIHGAADRIVLCATMAGLPLYLKLGYCVIGAKTIYLSQVRTSARRPMLCWIAPLLPERGCVARSLTRRRRSLLSEPLSCIHAVSCRKICDTAAMSEERLHWDDLRLLLAADREGCAERGRPRSCRAPDDSEPPD